MNPSGTFFLNPLFSFFRRLSSDIWPLSIFSIHSARIKFLSSLPFSSSSPKRKRERREKLRKGGGTAERRETLLRSLYIIVLLYFYISILYNLFFIASSFKRIWRIWMNFCYIISLVVVACVYAASLDIHVVWRTETLLLFLTSVGENNTTTTRKSSRTRAR